MMEQALGPRKGGTQGGSRVGTVARQGEKQGMDLPPATSPPDESSH